MKSSGEARVARESAARRATPPEATLLWLLRELGATAVVSCDVMPGGSTSAMHRVTVRTQSGTTTTVVLRRYVLESYLAEEPAAPVAEITALRLLDELAVSTPKLMAADPGGARADAPTIVMQALPGRPVWEPGRRQLEQLVDALIEIHAVDTSHVEIAPISRYQQRSYEPPRWATSPQTWERAVEIFHGPIPEHDVGFAHRDFHPGNVLWQRRHITGIVDWQNACRGPGSIDISHCRLNLAYTDGDLPRLLRDIWEHRSGSAFDPWADVMTIIGALDHLRDTPPGRRAQDTIDDILAAAVNELVQ
jgi:aminoglycoside phosphotransferase (APT) family kinase protein